VPPVLHATARLIASSASVLAGAMKPHVLITTTSTLSGSAHTKNPAWAISANILSLSTIFLGQPKLTKPTVVVFLRFLPVTASQK
jgi:hypothetical protein